MLVRFLNNIAQRFMASAGAVLGKACPETLVVTDSAEWAELWNNKDRRFALVQSFGWKCHIVDYKAYTASSMCGICPSEGFVFVPFKEDALYEEVCSTCATRMNQAIAGGR